MENKKSGPPWEVRRVEALHKFQEALSVFQELNPTMPIQMVCTFLTVARDEGKSLKEYVKLTGWAQSTISRHLQDLGERNRQKKPGLQLIDSRTDPLELRKKSFRLTPKGREFAKRLLEVLEER